MTTLSVVIPVRNVERYLGDALASLTRNVDPGYEFIVIDDGSTDDTAAVLADFGAELPTLQVIRHDTSVGLADARNVGLAAASGTYVTYLDGDDWLAPGYLAQLVAAIDGLQCDFVRVDHVQVEGKVRTLFQAPESRRDVVLPARRGILPLDERNMIDYPYAWAGIYRRSMGRLLEFEHGLHTAEDRPWIWRLHREAGSFAVVSLAGLFYRRLVADSLTQTADERQLHFFDAYDHVFAQVLGEPDILPKAVRQFLALLVHHIELAETARPALHDRIMQRAQQTIDTLPRDVLEASWLSGERAERLAPFMPSGLASAVRAGVRAKVSR